MSGIRENAEGEADIGAVLDRARGYPYPFPRESFVWSDGEELPFDPGLREGRTPVLAFGSNQSPVQLARKFGHQTGHSIPVERAVLHGFDVVYSAHIAAYGAVPAMLQAAPGAAVDLAITWLDDVQLSMMHETELKAANYFYAELRDVRLDVISGPTMERAFAYVGTRGHLRAEGGDGHPVPLAAVACKGRLWPAADTDGALEIVRTRHAPDMTPDDFVLTVVKDADFGKKLIDRLGLEAGPIDYPYRKII